MFFPFFLSMFFHSVGLPRRRFSCLSRSMATIFPSSSSLPHNPQLTHLTTSQLESKQYQPALALIDTLLTELKRLDDKMILTEVHLLESRVYRGIGNMAKSKVSSSILFFSPPSSVVLSPYQPTKLTPAFFPKGSPNLLPNSRRLNLLPTRPPSLPRPPIRRPPRRRQRLHHSLLILLRVV